MRHWKNDVRQIPNVKTIHGDVMLFQPEDQYDVVFLGGMLMYLNEEDVICLLEKLIPSLQPGGIILCRETTVRKGTTTRQGDYQAVVPKRCRLRADLCGVRAFRPQRANEHTLRSDADGLRIGQEVEGAHASATSLPSRRGTSGLLGIETWLSWITRVPTALGSHTQS